MARPSSPVVAARNHEIYSLFQRGSSVSELAGQFNLSPQRIGQVIAAQNPETDEDIDRSLYRGYLWRLFEEIRDLYRNPGWKMSPNGSPASGPDGEPAEDVMVRLQAGELELKILESLRKLDARDKAQERKLQVSVDMAQQQAAADIAERRAAMERERLSAAERRELEELRRLRSSVVAGEVVPELPPAS